MWDERYASIRGEDSTSEPPGRPEPSVADMIPAERLVQCLREFRLLSRCSKVLQILPEKHRLPFTPYAKPGNVGGA